jgi:hypothetical protein
MTGSGSCAEPNFIFSQLQSYSVSFSGNGKCWAFQSWQGKKTNQSTVALHNHQLEVNPEFFNHISTLKYFIVLSQSCINHALSFFPQFICCHHAW